MKSIIALIFTLLISSYCVTKYDSPNENYNAALRLMEASNFKDAATYLKFAIQDNSANYDYWLKYGECQLNRQRFKIAKSSFEEVLKLEPKHNHARILLSRVHSLAPSLTLNDSKVKGPKPFVITNTNIRKKLPRIPCDDLDLPDNIEYLAGRLPFILINCHHYFNLTGMSLESMLPEFGEVNADFYPHNMAYETVHPFMVPLRTAIDEFKNPTSAFPHDDSYAGTYIQWNLNQEMWEKMARKRIIKLPTAFEYDDKWLSTCLSPEMADMYMLRLHWRMVLIGSEGAGMFNHIDSLQSSSWQGQLMGSKLWHLCAPSESYALGKAGEVDCFNPNYKKSPNFRNADCYEDTLNVGEFMYYPKNYWHQTRNMETPTVSITGTMVDQNNYGAVMEELNNECKYKKFNWHFPDQLCAELEQCYKDWKEAFEHNKVIVGKSPIEKKVKTDL